MRYEHEWDCDLACYLVRDKMLERSGEGWELVTAIMSPEDSDRYDLFWKKPHVGPRTAEDQLTPLTAGDLWFDVGVTALGIERNDFTTSWPATSIERLREFILLRDRTMVARCARQIKELTTDGSLTRDRLQRILNVLTTPPTA